MFEKSSELLREARQFDAMLLGRPSLFFGDGLPLKGAPIFVERGSGAYLWDIDGNKLLDCVLGWGSVVLGHADHIVDSAAIATLRKGVNPTLVSPMQYHLAKLLNREVPNAESAAFFKSGSDATDVAVRISRAVTGRTEIAHWGFHGWHDWSSGGRAGILPEVKKHTHPLFFNDLPRCADALNALGRGLACVIVMPFDVDMPDPLFLAGLQQITHQLGAIFILDEIRTGFRVHRQGAQGLFKVDADLVTFGKALSNGYPISALCGRSRIMSDIIKLGITLTYFRSPVSMAAAIATIQRMIDIDGPAMLSSLGTRLRDNVQSLRGDLHDRFTLTGHPSMPDPLFVGVPEHVQGKCREMLCFGMLKKGVLTPALHHWFLSTSMTNSDIDFLSECLVNTARDVLIKLDSCSTNG